MGEDAKSKALNEVLMQTGGSSLGAWLKHFDKNGDQKITFDEFIPWQMKTVLHSLNDLRVLLSDPFTQAHVLEALKEDQFKLMEAAVQSQGTVPVLAKTKTTPVPAKTKQPVAEPALDDLSKAQDDDQPLGLQNIK